MILLLYLTYVCSPVLYSIIYKPLMAFWWNAKIRWMKKASGGKIVRYVIRWMKYNRVDRTGDLFVLRGCVPFNSIDHIVHIQPELTVSIGFPLKIHISYWFFFGVFVYVFLCHTLHVVRSDSFNETVVFCVTIPIRLHILNGPFHMHAWNISEKFNYKHISISYLFARFTCTNTKKMV